jgi:acyl-homoserine lactone acylase PvdQ
VRLALAGLLACAAFALAPGSALANPPTDDSGGAYNILAPGAEGSFGGGPYSTDQGELYSALTPKEGKVTQRLIEKDYLSEKFASANATLPTCTKEAPVNCVEKPELGLEIDRDSHYVPHIFGETRDAAMFGSGWVAAKDRGLLLKLGLGPAFVATMSVPGLNAFELLLTNRSFVPSKPAEEFVGNQIEVLHKDGPRGLQVIEDLEAWVEGVNAYEATLPMGDIEGIGKTVTLTDAIAGFAFIGSIFGNGGGNEVNNSNFLAGLEKKYPETTALKIFHDLRESNDPEAPTTGKTAFPYDKEPAGKPPAGAAVIEAGSFSEGVKKAMTATLASRRKMSNFLLVGSESTAAKHSIAVMGPQLGYYYPEIVMQADMHAPGLDASGVVAPISPYVFIGRGRDFAWSLTSASSENEQQFLLKLCSHESEPITTSDEYYEHENEAHEMECMKMKTFDAGKIGASGPEKEHEVFFKESLYGPVSGTVKVNGELYAVSIDRSTRGREPAGELAFSDLDSDRVHSPEQFFEAADELETTFNMAYIDEKHIAFISTGRLPKLAPETDPALPTIGTGPYDWKGILTLAEHPHEILTKGELLNWNNKPAPEWGAASSTFGYGPVHRVQMYRGFTETMKEENDVSIMNKAATEDLRGLDVWPVIEKVLEGEPAPSKLAEEAVKLIAPWVKKGAPLYGKERPKKAAAAVMDAIFDPIEETVLRPVLGEELENEFKSFASIDNDRNSGGSSFGEGWYGYVQKDLRTLLGEKVAEPYSRGYCGNGVLETCRKELWATIKSAVEKEQTAQGGALPKKWKASVVRIEFPPGILSVTKKKVRVPYTMPWTNRSTFQQVIEFSSHQEECLTETLAEAAENCTP